jgi:hypothetical protein
VGILKIRFNKFYSQRLSRNSILAVKRPIDENIMQQNIAFSTAKKSECLPFYTSKKMYQRFKEHISQKSTLIKLYDFNRDKECNATLLKLYTNCGVLITPMLYPTGSEDPKNVTTAETSRGKVRLD